METARAGETTIERTSTEAAAESCLRLLVGYDGRPGSRDALALAKSFAEHGVTELIVACVRPYWPSLVGVENFPTVIAEDERWVRRGATKVLGDIPFEVRVLAGGHETAGLKELAEAEGTDVIIVGSTHRGRAGRVCPGSVGDRVLDGSPCAVAIAPHGFADAEHSIERIAVGYDGSHAASVALTRAIGLAERHRASLLILGAVEISLGLAGFETRPPKEHQKADMKRHLSRARDAVPADVAVETRLIYGAPGHVLLEAAEGADLLVLGSRGNYGIVQRLLLGTVGTAAVRGASCPTLITPTA